MKNIEDLIRELMNLNPGWTINPMVGFSGVEGDKTPYWCVLLPWPDGGVRTCVDRESLKDALEEAIKETYECNYHRDL